MRHIIDLNRKWAFSKEATGIPTEVSSKWNFVNLPHSWNAIDGQDGGSDYFRGTAYYAKQLLKSELPEAQCLPHLPVALQVALLKPASVSV